MNDDQLFRLRSDTEQVMVWLDVHTRKEAIQELRRRLAEKEEQE